MEFPKAYTQQIAAVQVAREAANAHEQELRKQNFKAQEVIGNTAKAQADATKAQADAEAYSIAIKGKAQLDILAAPGGDLGQPAADRLGARRPARARRPAADLRRRRRQRRAHVPARIQLAGSH